MATFRGSGSTTNGAAFPTEAELQTAIDEAEAAQAAALASEVAAQTAQTAAELAETNAQASEVAVAADLVLTNADVVLTNADVVTTNADVVLTDQAVIDAQAEVVLAEAQVALAVAQVALADAARTGAETAETNAETAETGAVAAQAAAEVALDSFDDIYLGEKASSPTLDNDGAALVDGQLYWNTVSKIMYVRDSAAWVQWGGDYVLKTGGTYTGNIVHYTSTFAENDEGNSSTAVTIDWTLSNKALVTMTGNATLTFTAPVGPTNVVLKVVQDATGTRTITWPATCKWPAGTAPTLTTTASAVDIIAFYFDGTNYHGSYSLNSS